MHAGRPRTAGKHSSRPHHVPTPDKISGCGCSTRAARGDRGARWARPSDPYQWAARPGLSGASHLLGRSSSVVDTHRSLATRLATVLAAVDPLPAKIVDA